MRGLGVSQFVFAAVSRLSTGEAAIDFRAAAQRSSVAPMGKPNVSSADRPLRGPLSDLLAAMGMTDANKPKTWLLEMALEEIQRTWLARRELSSIGSYRKQLRRLRANMSRSCRQAN
jgi:hypothetical protein